MIFPRKHRDADEIDLVLCRTAVKNVLDLLRGEKSGEDIGWKDSNLRSVFIIIDMYYYNSFGWHRRNVPTIMPNRQLRRYLRMAQRCVYPEWRGDPKPVALHIESLLEKFREEYDIRALNADGPRAIEFFSILYQWLNRATNPKKR